ncbi:MAG: hypothetical protein VX367_13180 [SAR324 cluster bacterium]|nr:hypothetical protein [SAR324 cluster bacterium]
MRKPLAILEIFRTDRPTDTARCRVACLRLKNPTTVFSININFIKAPYPASRLKSLPCGSNPSLGLMAQTPASY